MKKTVLGLIILFTLFTIPFVLGIRINVTKSIPIGIYIVTNQIPQKNDYVIFCPSDIEIFYEAYKRGYINKGLCPNEYGYMMKKIVATEGDMISISKKGVEVNDSLLPFSTPLLTDLQDKALPQLNVNKILDKDEILLMSDISKTSFDARYFGVSNKKQIQGVIKPILIF